MPFNRVASGITSYRIQRANRAGPLVYALGVPVALAGAYLDSATQLPYSSAGNLIIAAGCIASSIHARTQRQKPLTQETLSWVPAFLAVWIASFPILAQNGGASSPLCLGYMILLFMGAAMAQTTFSLSIIVVFTGLNFAFWHGVHEPGHLHFTVSRLLSQETRKETVLLLAVIGCVAALLKAEEDLARDAENKNQALLETKGQLAHSAKMAEVGDLLATTAHELAQPIQVIATASSLLERLLGAANMEKRAEASILVSKIEEATWRAKRLLTQIRDFSRKDQFEPKLMDLRESLRSVQGFFQYDLNSKQIPFRLQVPDCAVSVRADNLKIQQVLLNLINNARDATLQAEVPEVTVTLENFRQWARITVSNTGPGIPVDIQRKLFTNYFTTKTKGRGTGLGLAICAELLSMHGGRIMFSSDSEKTVFVVDLPAEHALDRTAPGLTTQMPRLTTTPAAVQSEEVLEQS